MEPYAKQYSFTRGKAASRLACHSPHWCYVACCMIACRFIVTALGRRRFGFFTERQLSAICHCRESSEVIDKLAWQWGERQASLIAATISQAWYEKTWKRTTDLMITPLRILLGGSLHCNLRSITSTTLDCCHVRRASLFGWHLKSRFATTKNYVIIFIIYL